MAYSFESQPAQMGYCRARLRESSFGRACLPPPFPQLFIVDPTASRKRPHDSRLHGPSAGPGHLSSQPLTWQQFPRWDDEFYGHAAGTSSRLVGVAALPEHFWAGAGTHLLSSEWLKGRCRYTWAGTSSSSRGLQQWFPLSKLPCGPSQRVEPLAGTSVLCTWGIASFSHYQWICVRIPSERVDPH